MKNRILTAIAIMALLVMAFFSRMLTPYIFDILITFSISAVAGYEMAKLLSKMGKPCNPFIVAGFPGLLLILTLLLMNFRMPLYIVIIAMLGLIGVAGLGIFISMLVMKKRTFNEMKLRKNKDSLLAYSLKTSSNYLLAFAYPSFFFMFMTLLNHIESFPETYLKSTIFAGTISVLALVFAFIIPIFTDTFAMLTGGAIGGKKLCPKISPKKTISGAIGGIVWAVIASCLFFLIANSIPSINAAFSKAGFYIWQFIIIGFVASFVAQAGDLFESVLKRIAGVKDSSNFLPGHGGVLDRIDSHIFTLPIIFVSFVFMLI